MQAGKIAELLQKVLKKRKPQEESVWTVGNKDVALTSEQQGDPDQPDVMSLLQNMFRG